MNVLEHQVLNRPFFRASLAALAVTIWFAGISSGAEETRSILKSYFQTGDTPTEEQFGNLIESVVNFMDDDHLLGVHTAADGGGAILGDGAVIGSGLAYGPAEGLSSDWIGQSGFLAMSFEQDSQTHYGFLQITGAGGPGATDPYPMFVEYFVFENEPGAAITTSFVPEPGSALLGGIALFALLLTGRRCRPRL